MINNEGKEMINDYAVQNEVFVGNRRYLFAIHKNDKEPQRFLKCQCYDDDLFRHYPVKPFQNGRARRQFPI